LQTLKTQNITPDAIFATCGGGGWLSGSYLAKELVSPSSKMFGVEPKDADDADRSLKAGKILSLEKPSVTIADGARSTCVGNLTFEYLKKLDGFYTVTEEDILYHTQWLNHILKIRVEPTSAVTMGGVVQYVQFQPKDKERVILILLSGGNIDAETECKIWKTDYLG
jgi:threonine dehydratase